MAGLRVVERKSGCQKPSSCVEIFNALGIEAVRAVIT